MRWQLWYWILAVWFGAFTFESIRTSTWHSTLTRSIWVNAFETVVPRVVGVLGIIQTRFPNMLLSLFVNFEIGFWRIQIWQSTWTFMIIEGMPLAIYELCSPTARVVIGFHNNSKSHVARFHHFNLWPYHNLSKTFWRWTSNFWNSCLYYDWMWTRKFLTIEAPRRHR